MNPEENRDEGSERLQSIKKGSPWAGLGALSLVLLILVFIAPMPGELRALVTLGLFFGWSAAAATWLIRRFGRIAVVALAVFGLSILGSIGYAIWDDLPNRQVVAQIKELRGSFVQTKGSILVGKVEYVEFSWEAQDAEIRRFMELDGLDKLERLKLNETRINNETARMLGRLKQLKHLYIVARGLDNEVYAHLRQALPNCEIEIHRPD